jgi:CheY-like chemotaxis protein
MSEATPTAPLTVLLVDDDEDFQLQQKMILEEAGHSVVQAYNSDEAREILGSTTPDLAIVDLMMEHADAGFILCRDIKRDRPELPVILLTGVRSDTGIDFDAATDEERSWVKADAFLSKPVRFEQLQRELERLTQR